MHRLPSNALLCAALLSAVALAGCKRGPAAPIDAAASTSAPEVSTAAPVTVPAPAPSAALASIAVSTIELGNAIRPDGHVVTAMTRFGTADTIHAAVQTDGPAGTLTAKWLLGNTKVVHTRTVAAGPQVTTFEVSEPAGLPPGRHTLQVLLGGNIVQTREFDVR